MAEPQELTGDVAVEILVDVDGHTFRFMGRAPRRLVNGMRDTKHPAWQAAQQAIMKMEPVLDSYERVPLVPPGGSRHASSADQQQRPLG